jgi:peptide deformylase
MAETMYEAPGIGLAATQVDVHKRLIVIDTSEDKSDLLAFINPRTEKP